MRRDRGERRGFFSLNSRLWWLSLGVGIVLGILFTTQTPYFNKTLAGEKDRFELLRTFTRVLHLVENNYVEPVEEEKLIEGAIKGMLSVLDPHSVYLPPDQFAEMRVDTRGEFGGLGIEITLEDGVLTVVTPIEDTPAFKAGVEPGDKIVRIVDKGKKVDKLTKGLSLWDAVKLMRGKKGTEVTIHVVRQGHSKPIPITIRRDIIKVKSVKYGMLEEPKYGYVRITTFQERTSEDLKRAIDSLIRQARKKKAKLEGIVLDLRSNPGGLLDEAIKVGGLFVGQKPIVMTIGRDKKNKRVEVAKVRQYYKDLKLVVLVNEYSASASEIVAGALQDHKRALIVGKKTFGKGSVQTVIDLDNKGKKAGLKLTIARFYTPKGRSIQTEGVSPDIEVEAIDMELLEKMRKNRVIREKDLENHILGDNEKKEKQKSLSRYDRRPIKTKKGKRIRVDDPKEKLKYDYQLQQALAYLKVWDAFREISTNLSSDLPKVAKTADK